MKHRLPVILMTIILLVSINARAEDLDPGKKKISNINDLPRHTYVIRGTLTELLSDTAKFRLFAEEISNNINSDLREYTIEDKSTLKDFHDLLISVHMITANDAAALENIKMMRELEEKPANKLTNNLINEAIIKARAVKDGGETGYRQQFAEHLFKDVTGLPWEVVGERINKIKSTIEIYSENVLMGVVQSQFEPAVRQNNQIGNDIATEILNVYYLINVVLPLKEQIVDAFNRYIALNRVEKPDIWEVRKVDLQPEQDLKPVQVAIWDTGVDTSVFPDRLYVNLKEKTNGKDDDANGFVDDINGIAYTVKCAKTPEILYPIANPEKLDQLKDVIKGFNDLETSINSPETKALKEKLAAMQPEEVKPFIEEITQFAIYMHGTYTSSLAVDGNPFARILAVRFSIDHRAIPDPPTVEQSRRTARMYRDVIGYLKAHRVRVVNMSWHCTIREIERGLEVNGVGKDAKERAEMARRMFDIEKDAMYEAMKNAPEILFTCSAGNSNDDVAFEDFYPSSFDLPNVLVVGAVDQAGDVTGFTSFGANVDVYANGYEVEGLIPGGDKLPGSGTSASAPIVVNLAAKLFALDPALTPGSAIELIKKGADRSNDGKLLLINPKRSVELVKAR